MKHESTYIYHESKHDYEETPSNIVTFEDDNPSTHIHDKHRNVDTSKRRRPKYAKRVSKSKRVRKRRR